MQQYPMQQDGMGYPQPYRGYNPQFNGAPPGVVPGATRPRLPMGVPHNMYIPPRTHSAPPSLTEQMAGMGAPIFYPYNTNYSPYIYVPPQPLPTQQPRKTLTIKDPITLKPVDLTSERNETNPPPPSSESNATTTSTNNTPETSSTKPTESSTEAQSDNLKAPEQQEEKTKDESTKPPETTAHLDAKADANSPEPVKDDNGKQDIVVEEKQLEEKSVLESTKQDETSAKIDEKEEKPAKSEKSEEPEKSKEPEKPEEPASSPLPTETSTEVEKNEEGEVTPVSNGVEEKQEEEEEDWEKIDSVKLAPPERKEDSRKDESLAKDMEDYLKFPEGSWNPQPKPRSNIITYSREELLAHRNANTERPEGLPPKEVILNVDDYLRNSGDGRGKKGGEMRRIPSGGRFPSGPPPGLAGVRPDNKGRASMRRSNEYVDYRDNRKLPPPKAKSRSDTWIRPGKSGDEEKDRVQEIVRKARSILNKLTLEKFEPLCNQIINVGINNVTVLKEVISLVFQKALVEPHFSGMYAELCVRMSTKCEQFEDPENKDAEKQQKLTFRRLLLNRCQEEFEMQPAPPPEDGSIDKEEYEFKRKRRMLGNIKFIGELFKKGMLTEKIMHECLRKLLGDIKNPNPDNIESLSVLLTNIGKLLDHAKAAKLMVEYFKRIQELSKNDSLEPRIKFMLIDLIELKNNNWVPRRVNDNPKTIKEIHREAEEKDQQAAMESMRGGLFQRGGPQGRGMRGGPMDRGGMPNRGTPNIPRDRPRDNRDNRDNRDHRDNRDTRDSRDRNDKYDRNDRYDRTDRTDRDRGDYSPRTPDDRLPKQQKEPYQKQPQQSKQQKTRECSVEDFEDKIASYIEELLSSCEVEDSGESLNELFQDNASKIPLAIEKILNEMVEKSNKQLDLIIALLVYLKKSNAQYIISALRTLLQDLDELVIDQPKTPQTIGKLIAQLGKDDPSFLRALVELVGEAEHSPALLGSVFETLLQVINNKDTVRKLYVASKLDLRKVFEGTKSKQSFNSFIEKYKLEYLVA